MTNIVSVSKPRVLKFYSVTVLVLNENGFPKFKDGEPVSETKPVTCVGCQKPIEAFSLFVRTAEVTGETGTRHLPICGPCALPFVRRQEAQEEASQRMKWQRLATFNPKSEKRGKKGKE